MPLRPQADALRGLTRPAGPVLQRREKEGLIKSGWGTTDNYRRAQYHRLTASRRRALGEELESWRRFASGLEAVLRIT